MKKNFLISLFLLPIVAFSQVKLDISIDWLKKTEMSFGNYNLNIPQFSGNNYNYDASSKSINYILKISDLSSIDQPEVQLTNLIYEPISKAELGDLALENIPKTSSASIKITIAREQKMAFLWLSPIVKDDFGYKKIISFSYSIRNNTAKTTNISKSSSKNGIVNSVLATGDWYQFYVEKSGVYKISKSFIQSLGMNLSGVDPKKIKIYGNGGRMLPLKNVPDQAIDLIENAIEISGEKDGVFNDSDFILFYAEGVDVWNEESQTHVNLYDTKSYYYITAQSGEGKRIPSMAQPTEVASLNLTTFDDHQFHEIDLFNIARLGRRWFGESFEIKQDQEFDFNIPNIDTTTPIQFTATAAAAAYVPTSFKISANGQAVYTMPLNKIVIYSGTEFNEGSTPSNPKPTFNASENIKIKLSYDNGGVPGSQGFLDYLELVAKRKLQGYGKQFQFQFQYDASPSSSGTVNFTFTNAASIPEIWDITDIYNVTKAENLTRKTDFSFKGKLGSITKYRALDEADYYTPLKTSKTKIVNQNLKGNLFKNALGQFENIDYAIITPQFLATQAQKLAVFHRTDSNLNVKVITLESIYQEFSSGKQDVSAIRNCIKYIYDNASSTDKKIKYVNLFGDASYDFKNRTANNSNIVPIYHALSSNTSGESSFASDDFFGLMDQGEGGNTFGGIDISVGRMLNNDSKQADEMVNKVLEYQDAKSYGSWRNNITLISDDSDAASDATLQYRQNTLADEIKTSKPFLNVNKILLDSYVQEASAGGSRYPKARTDLFNAFEKGSLIFNYLGHGGEDGLTGERIWEKSDGQNLSNQYRYPLFVTITCDFSRFDNPSKPTAGEYTYWNPKGGAISMITTIRSISQGSAETFNDVLSSFLLGYNSSSQKATTMADALRLTKNSNPNSSTRVVFYIGDPALKLAIPKPKIILTKINDVPIATIQSTENFKSLSKIKVTGEVTDENNAIISTYNGELATAVFDKDVERKTLNNDGYSPSIPFTISGETIFKGNASVVNGKFEYNFVVPRDIRIPVGKGKISFYAQKSEALENETGYNTDISVGGINENAVADNKSPTAKLYMNDESFLSGGITNASPFLLAVLEDENGINTASGIGHDIVAVLDGDVSNPYILNDYYQTKLNDFTKGTLRFPLRNLSVGLHSLALKAWDVYNNPITVEIQFVVAGEDTITLSHVLNYPNPFVNYTEFWFTHNKPYEDLEVQIQVMTVTGKIVWTKNQIINTTGFLAREITWNGLDDFGEKIGKGVYIYKLTVKSNLTNKKVEKFEKLVIL